MFYKKRTEKMIADNNAAWDLIKENLATELSRIDGLADPADRFIDLLALEEKIKTAQRNSSNLINHQSEKNAARADTAGLIGMGGIIAGTFTGLFLAADLVFMAGLGSAAVLLVGGTPPLKRWLSSRDKEMLTQNRERYSLFLTETLGQISTRKENLINGSLHQMAQSAKFPSLVDQCPAIAIQFAKATALDAQERAKPIEIVSKVKPKISD